MSLNQNEIETLAQIAVIAAKEAGAMIRENAGREDLNIEKKETGASLASQVVTEVDQKSQDIVLKILNPTCEVYSLGMLAEESEDDGSRFENEYFWCIDPMDGTLPFIEAREGYSVSIALVSKEGVPVIGVVHDPLKNILYHAVKGQGVFRNEQPWTVDISQKDQFEEVDRGGAVMNACWVLEHGAGYFHKKPKKQNGGGCVWDYAATACIFETAGAWVSDMFGEPLELNRKEAPYMNHKGILFASHESIAKEIMKTI